MNDFKDRLELFHTEETGLAFKTLVRFAIPLAAEYGIDPNILAKSPQNLLPEEQEAAADILQIARLFWAYFRQENDDDAKLALQTALLGETPEGEEISDFEDIYDDLESHFSTFTQEEITKAEKSGIWSFPMVIDEFFDADFDQFTDEFGQTDSADLAIFAEPLLQEAMQSGNLDELDHVLEKASEYWYLAQLPENEQEKELQLLIRKLAHSASDVPKIKKEAQMMIARYKNLFQ